MFAHLTYTHRRFSELARETSPILVLVHLDSAGLELLDLLGDALLALLVGEAGGLVLEGLRLPVLRLFGGLERRVLTDRGVSVRVDLLDVLGADTVLEVGRELLLEATMLCKSLVLRMCSSPYRSSSSSSKLSMYSAT